MHDCEHYIRSHETDISYIRVFITKQEVSLMRVFSLMLFVAFALTSCKKDNPGQEKVVNGINVSIAVSTFNSFRTQGLSGHPGVAAVTWNDTLSNAAYNFAKAKAEDSGISSNNYFLSNGESILNFPAKLNYSRPANFALYYGFPADTDVKTVITAGFASNDQLILNGLMNPAAKQFGMGRFGGTWFVIMSN